MTALPATRCDPGEVVDALGELLRRPAWMADAACIEHPELPWVASKITSTWRPRDVALMRAVCDGCAVRDECLRFALEVGDAFGFYGGRTPAQRGSTVHRFVPRRRVR